MIEITIKGTTADEACSKVAEFARFIKTELMDVPTEAKVAPTPAPTPTTAVTLAPVAPTQTAPASNVPAAPVVPTAPPLIPTVPVASVPTAAPTYTLDMLAKAGAALAGMNKYNETVAVLQKYGVQSLSELPPERYGEIALDLRALGAQI